MVSGLLPTIGIPLPFFSYGGSGLWGFTILLFIVTLLPYLVGMSGLFYLFGAVLLGAGFLYYAIRMHFNHDDLC